MKRSFAHFWAIIIIAFFISNTSCKRSKKQIQSSGPLIYVVSPESFDIVAKSQVPVVLSICTTGTWCALSHSMNSVIEQAAKEKRNHITFAKMHVEDFEDTDPALARLKKEYQFVVKGVPTSLIIVNNKVIGTVEEEMDLEQFNKTITSILQTPHSRS